MPVTRSYKTCTRRTLAATFAALLFLVGCSGEGEQNWDFAPLIFPMANPSHLIGLSAFAIPDWSGTEPHNGIDLIVDDSLTSTEILSPTHGSVVRIESSENPFSHPPGQLLLKVTIRVNSAWKVDLVIEPGTIDDVTVSEQISAVSVHQGQTVAPGDRVADLLVGERGYCHLHYMVQFNDRPVCGYEYSSDTARGTFEDVSSRPASSLPDGNICYGG